MRRWAPHFYRELARAAGLPDEQIEQIIAHYKHAYEQQIPPLISLRHLAESCEVEYGHLRSRCARHDFICLGKHKFPPYRTFAIRKRSGGKRIISVPAPDLLQVQRWIHHHILARQKCHSYAFAYQPGKSIADCASMHLGCKWLIKMDLSRFFESITERQVYNVFRHLGYAPLVCFELARLCTRVDKSSQARKVGLKWNSGRRSKNVAIEAYSHPNVGYLPQGAPTSPMLSNLVAFGLDDALSAIADDIGAQYTRYSDDLHFSIASANFTKVDAVKLVRRISAIITTHGFDLNRSKTAIAGPGHRRLVLGILVDGHSPRLSREFRRRLEWHYRHCLADPAHHAEVKSFDSVLGLKNHVNGLLVFAKAIDPHYVARLEERPIAWPI
jgi:RNA-directed DNA polymerase